MRIIGGTFRSRSILAPADAATTRPITDRVKENLFNRLMSMNQLGGGVVLDVFAGTGSLGLEALSRGAEHVTFVERDRDARRRLERNITDLHAQAATTVLSVDALAASWERILPHQPVDLAFLDPPYRFWLDPRTAARMLTSAERLANLLDPDAALVLRLPSEVPPPTIAGCDMLETARYNTMSLLFFQPQSASPAPTQASPSDRPVDDG